MDLSYPPGASVNDYIPKDTYLGLNITLKFPTVDNLAKHIAQLGTSCRMFKRDLQRAFYQISLDPADFELFGFIWQRKWYWETVLVIGHCIAPYICQCITDAIKFIHCRIGLYLLNYVDDFLGAEEKSRAQAAYERLGSILNQLGLQESVEKSVPPTEVE